MPEDKMGGAIKCENAVNGCAYSHDAPFLLRRHQWFYCRFLKNQKCDCNDILTDVRRYDHSLSKHVTPLSNVTELTDRSVFVEFQTVRPYVLYHAKIRGLNILFSAYHDSANSLTLWILPDTFRSGRDLMYIQYEITRPGVKDFVIKRESRLETGIRDDWEEKFTLNIPANETVYVRAWVHNKIPLKPIKN